MIVTGAFLAEKAVAVDDLLHVWGGALSGWAVHPEYRRAEFMLVVLAQVQTGENDRTITVEVIPPKDTARSLVMTREYPQGWPETAGRFRNLPATSSPGSRRAVRPARNQRRGHHLPAADGEHDQ